MKTKMLILPACIVLAAAQPATAQGLAGISHEGSSVSLAYNFHNNNEGAPYSENFTAMLSAQSSYSFGSNLGAIFTLGYQSETFDDSFYTERFLFDVNPTYDIGMGTVGVYYATISSSGLSESTHTNYGVTADIQSGPLGLEAYAGNYDVGDAFEHNPYGIAASYDVSSDTSVYLAYEQESFSSDAYNAAMTIGATYDLSNVTGAPIRVTGAATRHGFDELSFSDSEWNQFSIKASYDIGGGSASVFNGFRSWSFYYD